MKQNQLRYVLKCLSILLIFTFLLDQASFYVLNKVSDQIFTGQTIGKVNHYLAVKEEMDVLIYGSSRANHSLDLNQLSKKSFNIGRDGKQIAYAATLVLLLKNTKPQIILVHIDPAKTFSKTYSAEDIEGLMIKYHRIDRIKTEINRWHHASFINEFYRSSTYAGLVFGILKNYLKPNYIYTEYNGYDPLYVNTEQTEIFKKILANTPSMECESKFEINSIYNYYIDALVEFSKEHNKKLIFFTSPILSDTCEEDNRFMQKFMKSKGAVYIDYTDYLLGNGDLSNWKDNEHLSDKGAQIFSREVSKLFM